MPFAAIAGSGAGLISLFIDKLILEQLDSDPTISELIGVLGSAPVSPASKTLFDFIFARNINTGGAVEAGCAPYR